MLHETDSPMATPFGCKHMYMNLHYDGATSEIIMNQMSTFLGFYLYTQASTSRKERISLNTIVDISGSRQWIADIVCVNLLIVRSPSFGSSNIASISVLNIYVVLTIQSLIFKSRASLKAPKATHPSSYPLQQHQSLAPDSDYP